jgi:hypothetical protein
VLGPDGELDHFSLDELVTTSGSNAVIRFSETGYYRVKILFVDYWGWSGMVLYWKPPGLNWEVVPRRSLFAMHPGLGVPITVLANGIPAAENCEAGSLNTGIPALAETGLGGVRVCLTF